MTCTHSNCKKCRHLPATFAVLGGNPGGSPGHSEANVSKNAFFACSDLQRLSNTFGKREPAEAYLSTLAFFDVQKHTMFSCFHAAICATSQHFRVSVQGSGASAPWVALLSPRKGFPWAPWHPPGTHVSTSARIPGHLPGEGSM